MDARARYDAFVSALFPVSILIRRSHRFDIAPESANDADTVYRYSIDIYPTIQPASARVLRSTAPAGALLPRPVVKNRWDRYEYPKLALNRSGASRGVSRGNEPAIEGPVVVAM